MNVIQQLKENQRPFGLMSEEMREKAREMCRSEDLQEYTCNKRWERHLKGYVLRESTTYRLRPDYKKEPEIIEFEILDGELGLMAKTGDGLIFIHEAISQQGFIGFKFEDGCIRPVPVVYTPRNAAITCCWDVKAGNMTAYTVLHATAVLFRRPK